MSLASLLKGTNPVFTSAFVDFLAKELSLELPVLDRGGGPRRLARDRLQELPTDNKGRGLLPPFPHFAPERMAQPQHYQEWERELEQIQSLVTEEVQQENSAMRSDSGRDCRGLEPPAASAPLLMLDHLDLSLSLQELPREQPEGTALLPSCLEPARPKSFTNLTKLLFSPHRTTAAAAATQPVARNSISDRPATLNNLQLFNEPPQLLPPSPESICHFQQNVISEITRVYMTYVLEGGEREVNLPGELKEQIKQAMNELQVARITEHEIHQVVADQSLARTVLKRQEHMSPEQVALLSTLANKEAERQSGPYPVDLVKRRSFMAQQGSFSLTVAGSPQFMAGSFLSTTFATTSRQPRPLPDDGSSLYSHSLPFAPSRQSRPLPEDGSLSLRSHSLPDHGVSGNNSMFVSASTSGGYMRPQCIAQGVSGNNSMSVSASTSDCYMRPQCMAQAGGSVSAEGEEADEAADSPTAADHMQEDSTLTKQVQPTNSTATEIQSRLSGSSSRGQPAKTFQSTIATEPRLSGSTHGSQTAKSLTSRGRANTLTDSDSSAAGLADGLGGFLFRAAPPRRRARSESAQPSASPAVVGPAIPRDRHARALHTPPRQSTPTPERSARPSSHGNGLQVRVRSLTHSYYYRSVLGARDLAAAAGVRSVSFSNESTTSSAARVRGVSLSNVSSPEQVVSFSLASASPAARVRGVSFINESSAARMRGVSLSSVSKTSPEDAYMVFPSAMLLAPEDSASSLPRLPCSHEHSPKDHVFPQTELGPPLARPLHINLPRSTRARNGSEHPAGPFVTARALPVTARNRRERASTNEEPWPTHTRQVRALERSDSRVESVRWPPASASSSVSFLPRRPASVPTPRFRASSPVL
eukprot:g18641.t1